MRQFVWKLLLALILLQLVVYLAVNKDFFTRNFDPAYYAQLYSKSQYVLGPASKGGIGDDGLYTFAGYYYLFQGGDVSAVNFEHPPVGKYLIGLSLLIFRNENIINIFYYLALLFVTYRIGKIILRDNLQSIIAVGFLSSNLLILDNLKRSLLDIPFTLFFTLAIYFFLRAQKKAKYHYFSMFFWALAFATRFFPALLLIYACLFLLLFFYRRKHLPVFFLSSFLIPAVYLFSHLSFFVYHPSVIEFLQHKKWMLSWFAGSVTIAGNIWRNIFTGHYIDANNRLVRNEHWSMFIPFIVVFALLPLVKNLPDKKKPELLVLYGVCLVYLIYLTVNTLGLEKFLMPIYPLLCILAVGNILRLYSIIIAWRRPTSRRLKVS